MRKLFFKTIRLQPPFHLNKADFPKLPKKKENVEEAKVEEVVKEGKEEVVDFKKHQQAQIKKSILLLTQIRWRIVMDI